MLKGCRGHFSNSSSSPLRVEVLKSSRQSTCHLSSVVLAGKRVQWLIVRGTSNAACSLSGASLRMENLLAGSVWLSFFFFFAAENRQGCNACCTRWVDNPARRAKRPAESGHGTQRTSHSVYPRALGVRCLERQTGGKIADSNGKSSFMPERVHRSITRLHTTNLRLVGKTLRPS